MLSHRGLEADDIHCTMDLPSSENISCVCLQLGTNEARDTSSPYDTAAKLVSSIQILVDSILSKWPKCKIVISLSPPRGDEEISSTIQNIANNSLKCLYAEGKNVTTMCNDDLGYNGCPEPALFSRDLIHLSQQGTKILASKLKWEIHNALKIK